MADWPVIDKPNMVTSPGFWSSSSTDPHAIRRICMVPGCRWAYDSAFNAPHYVCIGICTVKSRCWVELRAGSWCLWVPAGFETEMRLQSQKKASQSVGKLTKSSLGFSHDTIQPGSVGSDDSISQSSYLCGSCGDEQKISVTVYILLCYSVWHVSTASRDSSSCLMVLFCCIVLALSLSSSQVQFQPLSQSWHQAGVAWGKWGPITAKV